MTANRYWAITMGFVLAILGLVGLFSTSFLGLFSTSKTLAVIYLITGIIGLLAGYSAQGRYCRLINQIVGWVYLAFALFGFALRLPAGVFGLVYFTLPANILDLVVALVSLYIGYAMGRRAMGVAGEERRRVA